MSQEKDLAQIDGWLGRNPVSQALRSLDFNNLPDDSFRRWPDPVVRPSERTPANDDIMHEEQLVRHGVLPLRTNTRVLGALLLGHGHVQTIPEAISFIAARVGTQGLVNENLLRIAFDDFANTRLVTREMVEGVVRYRPDPSFVTTTSQAGFLSRLAVNHELSLQNVFGANEGGESAISDQAYLYGNQTELTASKDAFDFEYLQTRIKVLREIARTKAYEGCIQAKEGLAISMTTLNRDLGIAPQRARGHLDALVRSGIVTKKSISPSEEYVSLDLNPDQIDLLKKGDVYGNFLTKLITEYVLEHPTGITSSRVLEYVMDQDPTLDDGTEEARSRVLAAIRLRLTRFAKTKIATNTSPFSFGQRSLVVLDPAQGQVGVLRDIALTLTSMQESEQPVREKEGLALGKDILTNGDSLVKLITLGNEKSRWSKRKPKSETAE